MFLCAYTTLQTTTRLTRKVRRVFFGRLRVTLKRAFCGRVALKKNRLFTADVQNDAPSPSRMHAVMLSIDQRPCR